MMPRGRVANLGHSLGPSPAPFRSITKPMVQVLSLRATTAQPRKRLLVAAGCVPCGTSNPKYRLDARKELHSQRRPGQEHPVAQEPEQSTGRPTGQCVVRHHGFQTKTGTNRQPLTPPEPPRTQCTRELHSIENPNNEPGSAPVHQLR